MPLAEQLWGPLGMTSWVVIQFEPGPDGAAPPYRLKTVSEWESREKLSMAVASKEGKILRMISQSSRMRSPLFWLARRLFGRRNLEPSIEEWHHASSMHAFLLIEEQMIGVDTMRTAQLAA